MGKSKTKTKSVRTSSKQSKDALGALAKRDVFLFDPEDLVLVDDESSPLYDARVHPESIEDKADEALAAQAFENLVLNIMAIGCHTPITVRKNPETGKTEVVAGRRRVRAMREGNKRLRKQGLEPHRIMAVVKRGDDAAQMGVLISENELRQGDSMLGRARKLAKYLELGRSKQEALVTFGMSAGTFDNLMAFLEAPACVKQAEGAGLIASSDAYRLAKLSPDKAKEKLDALLKVAPKQGGKRRKGDSSAAAREILTGVAVPSKKEQKQLLWQVQTSESMKEGHRQGAEAVLRWILGERQALEAIL
jgi:ParB family chromosome partitioning protein